jgi:hypothetical protein
MFTHLYSQLISLRRTHQHAPEPTLPATIGCYHLPCKCRFEDAHTARLAYDQVIAGLGLRKPTNYHTGTYPLDNPDVEAKLQEYLSKNPEAAAAGAAGRADTQQQAASAHVPSAAAAPTSNQQVLDGAPELAACWPLGSGCHGTAAGGVDIVAACVAEAASADAGQVVAATPASNKVNDACAAAAAAASDDVPCAHTMQQLLVARSASGGSSSSTACTISVVNGLFHRAGSETCSSEHPVAAGNTAAADTGRSSGSILLLGLLPCAVTSSAMQPSPVPNANTAAPAITEVLLPERLAHLHSASSLYSPGSLLGAM